ncbi:MAG: potassium channel protein [Bacteroidota bacterium]
MRRSGPGRELALGAVIVTGLLGIGTLGYMWLESMRPLDALYMTFITLSTIGFTEVRDLSDGGRIFTMAIATVGIGTFATLATRAVQIIVLTTDFRTRRMQRRIDALSNHYVVCGYGRIGERIVAELLGAGREVVVIDRAPERVQELIAAGIPHLADDAVEDRVLHAAGVKRASGLILVLPEDAENVFVALSAREIRPDDGPGGLFIVSRTNEQTATRKLLRAGVDKVVSPLEIGADRIAQTILRPRVDRFMEQILGVGTMDFDLEEIPVTRGSVLDGASLVEMDFRRRYNSIVVGVLKGSGEWRFNPDAREALEAGDTLIVLGSPDRLGDIREGGGGRAPA